MTKLSLVPFLGLLLLCLATGPTPVSAQIRGNGGGANKLTLARLVLEIRDALLDAKRRDALEALVREQGVDLSGTVLDTLDGIGAWPSLLELLEPMVVEPTTNASEPTPSIQLGSLSVSCEPLDCGVIVQPSEGGPAQFARTRNKTRLFENVPVGPASIVVFNDGYATVNTGTTVEADKTVIVRPVVLLPLRSPVNRNTLGKAVLFDLLEATKDVDPIEGKGGGLRWSGANDGDHDWTISKFSKRPGEDLSITFQSRTGKGSCEVSLAGLSADAKKKVSCKDSLKNSSEEGAEAAARLFLRYQPFDFARTLMKEQADASETDPVHASFASQNGGSVEVTLNDEGLLVGLRHTSPEVGSIVVRYSDYTESLEPGRYPRRMMISDERTRTEWDFSLDMVVKGKTR